MSLLLDSIVTSKYQSFSQASEKELSDLIKDVITHAISRIQQATEFPPVKEELELIKNILQPTDDNGLIKKYAVEDLRVLRAAFLAAHELYADWLKFIIEFVTIEWSYCFSEEDKRQLLDLFFACSSPSISFMTLCQSIGADSKSQGNQPHRGSSEQVVLHEVSRWLVPFTENKFAQLLLEVTTDVTCARRWPLLLVLATSLGDRIVNRLARKTDPRFLTPHYFERLSEQIVDALMCDKYQRLEGDEAVTVDWTQQSVINTWSQLFGKLSTLGHADTLISRLVAWQMSPECQNVTWKLAKIIEHLPDSQTENLIAALITHLSHYDYAAACNTLKQVLALSSHKSTVRYQLTNKLLIQRALEPLAHLLLVDYLYDTLPRDFFVQTLLELATIWSRQHVAESLLIILTRALGRGLARLGEEAHNEMRLLTTIFEGVSTHLATPPSVTRQSAESIASLTAHLTAPDITPPFDNKPPLALGIGDDWLTVTRVMPVSRQVTAATVTPTSAAIEVREKNQQKLAKKSRAPREIDPDQLYLNDGEDSDDSLPEFTDQEDLSDLSDVKVPVYLRDCLNNLMNDEPDLLEVTLHNLAALIRRAPDDLDELSVPIANALIHLNNEYQLRDFDKCLTDSLTALIAGSTAKVVTFITAQFYAANYSLQQRMLMLDVLTRGARELSALPKINNTPANEPRNTQLTLTSHATVTRAITRPAPPKTAINKFAPHAGLFIYPLLQQYDRKSALLDLYHQDGIVLGQLLYSLGVFVECLNGNATAPVLLQIAQALLEVVWAVRHYPALTVRRAVLYLCVCLCSSLPLAVLSADELRGEFSELLAWGVSVVKGESDEDCRVLATALVTKLVQLIDQNALQIDA